MVTILEKTHLKPPREYPCQFCKAIKLKYGCFKKEAPNYKEVRTYSVHQPEKVKVEKAEHFITGDLVALIVTCKCSACGKMGKHTIVLGADV